MNRIAQITEITVDTLKPHAVEYTGQVIALRASLIDGDGRVLVSNKKLSELLMVALSRGYHIENYMQVLHNMEQITEQACLAAVS